MPRTVADILPRLEAVCLTGATHPDYALTVDRAVTYRRLATGKGIEHLMRQYASQETDAEYASRVAMMITTVPAWWDQARKKYYEVARLRGGTVVKRFDYGPDLAVSDVDRLRGRLTQAVNGYYQEEPLEAYLAEQLTKSHCMSDPNAWQLTDFGAFDYRTEVPQPYPVLFPCEAAVDFGRLAGKVSYFVGRLSIPQSASAYRYVCWLDNEAVDCWPVLYDGNTPVPTMPEGAVIMYEMKEPALNGTADKVLYQCRLLKHNAKRVPLKVLGYVVDEEGSGESFVSPLHAGVCFLKQSLKVGSENDIVMSQMSSPIRAAYANDCPGEVDPATGAHYTCKNGINMQLFQPCGACGGTGEDVNMSTTALRTVTVPYPKKDEDIPVKPADAMAFLGPSVDLPKFQVDYLDRAGKLFMQTIFGNYDGARVGTKTATEDKIDQQSELTALAPFADWFSAAYVHHAKVCAAYVDAGAPEVTYEFPADLEKVTLDDLLALREKAVKARADSNQLEALDDQIAIKQYANDPEGLLKNRVKRRHMTFLGQPNEWVTQQATLGYISADHRVRRTHVDIIFGELEVERTDFYQLAYPAQVTLVDAKVKQILAGLPSAAASMPRMNLNPLAAPATV